MIGLHGDKACSLSPRIRRTFVLMTELFLSPDLTLSTCQTNPWLAQTKTSGTGVCKIRCVFSTGVDGFVATNASRDNVVAIKAPIGQFLQDLT